MRERTFRRPSVQEILKLNGFSIPGRVTKNYLRILMNKGNLIFSGYDSGKAVKTVESYMGKSNIILFPKEFEGEEDYANKRIKSLEGFLKMDSIPVLRELSGMEDKRIWFGKHFVNKYNILPEHLIQQSLSFYEGKKSPLGFYWIGIDGSARATTWLRAVTGGEMEVMRQKGDFSGEILDKIGYGSNLRVNVRSRTEEDKFYEFTLSRLPLSNSKSFSAFGNWINMSHNSNDPDASYRGLEFDKKAKPTIFWSAPTIAGFYHAAHFFNTGIDTKKLKVNPFPIPTPEMLTFIDDLRTKSLIATKEGKIRALNKTEIDNIIGGKTKLQSYSENWFHKGKRDISYLYGKNN